jgi:hypothetical protein
MSQHHGESVLFWCFFTIVLPLVTVGANAQSPVSPTGFKLPTKELKFDAKGLERVLSAKTVAVLAESTPFIALGDGAAEVTFRGRRVGPEKAKADVEKVLSKWGAFSLVEDPAVADLVLVIEEQTIGPSVASSGKPRLRDTLAVFPTGGPGSGAPLWVGIDTESALAAGSGLTTPDAEGVVEKFQRDVESARKRLQKR